MSVRYTFHDKAELIAHVETMRKKVWERGTHAKTATKRKELYAEAFGIQQVGWLLDAIANMTFTEGTAGTP